ncbi:uncharacterized protein BDFB_005692, partial [Asbolus verrucosus]
VMMTENIATAPYIIQINEPVQTIHLTEQIGGLGIQIDPNMQELATLSAINNQQIFVESPDNPIEIVHESSESVNQDFGVIQQDEQPFMFQIVYPQELNLSPASNTIKRGRPKKKKPEEVQRDDNCQSAQKTEVAAQLPKTARTRSGRLVKLPKYIEKDFKKIEITTDEQEIQVSDFKRFEEKENSKMEFAELHTKKRMISAQYKCPKCFKAYLGKNKMIQHLKKYPDHGPLPEGYQQFNFDVWNYLFDITQKCKSGQRGVKFCEELSNLLHNVQLLKSALFKTVTDNKNCVQIDKVLGNAIGLSPGKYKFDENELYKDVTVLKLITNSEFFKPSINNKQSSDSVVVKNKNEDCDEREKKKLKQDETSLQCLNKNYTITNDNPEQSVICHNVIESNNTLMSNYTHKPENAKIQEQTVDNYTKKVDVHNQMSLHSDLLTDNLLLHSLPNPRNSVEELMLTSVDNGSSLLDNSTSSDEVMNVDQFVNERFKKIIEPDIELSNTSLNLDLPSLELFQFHTS